MLLEKSQSGTHDPALNTEARLKLATEEFNAQPGMIQKWRIDEDKFKACLNLMVGTTPGARCLIQHHLNFHKWQLSCFTAELLRSTRWLLGASPRYAKEAAKVMLTVDKEVQEHFLRNHISWFSVQAKKTKISARPKLRPSVADWDRLVDYTCIMQCVRKQAAQTLQNLDPEALQNVMDQIQDAFMARPGVVFSFFVEPRWHFSSNSQNANNGYLMVRKSQKKKERQINVRMLCVSTLSRDYYVEVMSCLDSALPNWSVKHLSLWSELVEPQALAVPNISPEEVETFQEATCQAQFQELMSKIVFLSIDLISFSFLKYVYYPVHLFFPMGVHFLF